MDNPIALPPKKQSWQIIIEVDKDTIGMQLDTGNVPVIVFLGVVEMLVQIADGHRERAAQPVAPTIMPVRSFRE